MKKHLYLLLILIWFWPACTTQKHVQKEKSIEKQESVTQQKIETHQLANTQTSTQNFSITTIREESDTSAEEPGSFLIGEKKLGDLLTGDALKVESKDQILEVYYDSATNTIKAKGIEKPDKVPMKFNRMTEKKEYGKSSTSGQENTSIVDEKQISEKWGSTKEQKEMQVKITYWPFLIGGAVALIVVIVLLMRTFQLWRRKMF